MPASSVPAVTLRSGTVSRSPSYIRDSNLTRLAYEEWKKCDPLHFRARLDFTIPFSFSGQRGITPAFGYGTPHPGARGT
jgi:hypothetical protein